MKAKWVVPAGIICLACGGGILIGQEKEDRTLLSHEQMTAIINEVSGERAMHHVLELVPYQFVRPPSEYQGHFRESEVMAKFAKEYGFSNVAIEDYPTGQTYQPVVGELWTTAPKSVKIYDIHDIPESLASTNANGDISGELVNVGQGTAQDFDSAKTSKVNSCCRSRQAVLAAFTTGPWQPAPSASWASARSGRATVRRIILTQSCGQR